MKGDIASNDDSGVARHLATVLRSRPSALLFDFDGTLSELSSEPDSATIRPEMEHAVRRLTDLTDVVGIVTGRAAQDVMTKFDTSNMVIVGNHGLETFHDGVHVEHDAGVTATASIDAAMSEIQDRLVRDKLDDGVIFENKRLSASIHYRNAPNQKQVGSVLIPLSRRIATGHGLRLTEGKLIVELRPMEEVSKGTAVTQLVEELNLRAAVFLGDDLTDVDGFEGLRALREADVIDAVAVGVIGPDSHPRVAASADVLVMGVDGVANLLDQLIHELEQE